MKIAYVTPALYMAGGMERVLTVKANYLADVAGHDVYIIVTEGRDREPFYPLSARVSVVQLGIDFDEIYRHGIVRKGMMYLAKQRLFRRRLTAALMEIRPDVTDSLLRRDINFLCDIKDGSVKIGEIHNNRRNYRNFEANETSALKRLFARYWMRGLVRQLKRLERFVVLSHEDAAQWTELQNVTVISNPVSITPDRLADGRSRRVIAVGRYAYQKGFDLLIDAWQLAERRHPDWHLYIYGAGERAPYEQQARRLGLRNCHLEGATKQIVDRYTESSIYVLSSRFEGFPMVLPEAMACGLPVVAFTCPCGTRDCVSDGEDGLWVDNGDVAQLAEKLCWMMEHDEERRLMGQRAARNVERLRLERVMQQWLTLFSEVTHG